MDDLLRLELDTLLESARAAREARPDEQPQGDDAPLALVPARRDAMLKVLARCVDPMGDGKAKLQVRRVHATAAEPDDRGLIEVNYLDQELQPMTAFMRGAELAYVCEGW